MAIGQLGQLRNTSLYLFAIGQLGQLRNPSDAHITPHVPAIWLPVFEEAVHLPRKIMRDPPPVFSLRMLPLRKTAEPGHVPRPSMTPSRISLLPLSARR
ncbi:hypothetical protein GGTG_08733 [Gaeumannomyces tritici R3-111a-1]|uniref:Uncharacterized protein n=1 Tax=Gaeumannomyces tritici (strain R3-111a-1) TaxID=644352 RepID=J3P5E4_GAET3|nr:hypothetical protein GGTG_08733 [Gaeumannomyces tritici R3-111a-1]EJT74895.1 hypothetical protein GGTG_08733 [Gaeumannomyces tritici R3-111a-1]